MVQRSAQEDIAQSVGESISAAVDDEMNDLDLQRVLKQSSDEGVREKWRHSHLIGAALRGELNERNSIDISAGVFAALEEEVLHDVSPVDSKAKFGNVFNMLGKSAVAASVALAVLIGARYIPQQNQPATDEVLADTDRESIPVTPILESIPVGFDSPRVKARVVSANPNGSQNMAANYRQEPYVIPVPEAPRSASDPKVQAYLNHLLLIHAEQSSQASVIGVLPYVRVLYPANQKGAE